MKTTLWVALALGVLVSACGKSESGKPAPSTNTAAGENPLSAPADYVGAMGRSKALAEKTVDVTALNQALQLFNVQEGRYPKTLKELVDEGYLPRIPAAPYGKKIVYDAAKGTVSIVAQ